MYTPSWYRYRGYQHFDVPSPYKAARNSIHNPVQIAKHAFWPFLSMEIPKPGSSTKRSVMYASHMDANIYAYYVSILEKEYEDYLHNNNLSNAVLAYRKLNGKCNIHFAYEAFTQIKNRIPIAVIALDIHDFFGSIDHDILKNLWNRIMHNDNDKLSKDHYAVYKQITRHKCVDKDELLVVMGVDPRKKHEATTPICTPSEFRELVRNRTIEVKKNTNGYGIPQGSPISAILSNIYMVDFDQEVNREVEARGGVYYRYSDDILVICPVDHQQDILSMIIDNMKKHKLKNNEEKQELTIITAEPAHTTEVQYLGFTFNGINVRVRTKTLARYFCKLNKSIYREFNNARKRGLKRFAQKKLYQRFSVAGKRNYITYSKRAVCIMSDLGTSAMQKQHRKAWTSLKRKILKMQMIL